METLRALWSAAGATDIETRIINVHRTFASFEEFWSIAMTSSVGTIIGKMSATDAERLKSRVRERLPADASGRVTGTADANAIKGRVTKSPVLSRASPRTIQSATHSRTTPWAFPPA